MSKKKKNNPETKSTEKVRFLAGLQIKKEKKFFLGIGRRKYEMEQMRLKQEALEKKNKELQERLDESLAEKVMQEFNGVSEKANTLTDKILNGVSEVSDKANTHIADGINFMATKGNEFLEEGKKKYVQVRDKANNMAIEDKLASNFNEEIFVQAVLEGLIEFSYEELKRGSFLTNEVKEHRWTSTYGYFHFILKENDKSFLIDPEFQINRTSIEFLPVRANLTRLYNIITKRKDNVNLSLTEAKDEPSQ
jgi:hypothetical protein